MALNIYTMLESIQTTLQALKDDSDAYIFGRSGQNVIIGNDFTIDAASLPLGLVYMPSGDIKNKSLNDCRLIIGVVLVQEDDGVNTLYEKIINTMEYLIKSDLKLGNILTGPIAFNTTADFLSEIYPNENVAPLLPPYGGFWLEYRLSRGIY